MRAIVTQVLSVVLSGVLALSPAVRVQASPAGSIAAGVSVSAVISEIRAALLEIIDKLQFSASVLSYDVAGDLTALARTLEELATRFEGKLFEDLNELEQQTMRDVVAVVDRFNEGNLESLREVRRSVAALGTELSRVPGVDDVPLVMSVTPAYHLDGSADVVEVKFEGSALGRADAVLTFGGRECRRIGGNGELMLRFECRAQTMWEDDGSWSRGDLKLARDYSAWRFWKSDIAVAYPVAIKRISRKLGEVTVEVVAERIAERTHRRHAERAISAARCEQESRVFRFRPNENCKVLPDSVSLAQLNLSSQSRRATIHDVRQDSIAISAQARGSGDKILGKCTGGDGINRFRVMWREVCRSSEQEKMVVSAGTPIEWLTPVTFDMPPGTRGYVVTVSRFDGATEVLTGGPSNGWLDVEYVKDSGKLVVRPRSIEAAMR